MQLALEVYSLLRKFPKEEMYGIVNQIRRSAISLPSNIAEGSQRKSDKEFSRFILIAKGSLSEMETQFLLSHELNYLTTGEFEKISLQINELDKMLFSFNKRLTANS